MPVAAYLRGFVSFVFQIHLFDGELAPGVGVVAQEDRTEGALPQRLALPPVGRGLRHSWKYKPEVSGHHPSTKSEKYTYRSTERERNAHTETQTEREKKRDREKREKETERERKTETEKDRDRHRERQQNKDRDTHTAIESERDRDRN